MTATTSSATSAASETTATAASTATWAAETASVTTALVTTVSTAVASLLSASLAITTWSALMSTTVHWTTISTTVTAAVATSVTTTMSTVTSIATLHFIFWLRLLTLDLFTVNLVELVFETLANYAVAFEDNKTEWLILAGFFVDWSGEILDITEGAKVFSKSFISGFGLDTADKHFTIASFGFFGVNLFTIDFVTTRGKDGID